MSDGNAEMEEMDSERAQQIETLLKQMAGIQTDLDGRPVELLPLDAPAVWPWICVGPALPIDPSDPDPRAVTHCPRHPQEDQPPRLVMHRYEIGSWAKDASGSLADPGERHMVLQRVYVGQCADCGTIFWAWEVQSPSPSAEDEVSPFD